MWLTRRRRHACARPTPAAWACHRGGSRSRAVVETCTPADACKCSPAHTTHAPAHASRSASTSGGEPGMLSQQMLRKYITYAKQTCRPKLQTADYDKVAQVRRGVGLGVWQGATGVPGWGWSTAVRVLGLIGVQVGSPMTWSLCEGLKVCGWRASPCCSSRMLMWASGLPRCPRPSPSVITTHRSPLLVRKFQVSQDKTHQKKAKHTKPCRCMPSCDARAA